MTPADPFDRIPDPDAGYAGTVLETAQERDKRLAADPIPPHPTPPGRGDRTMTATFKVEDQRGRVILETDDWVEAESRALTENWPKDGSLHVRGTHPTHDWDGKPRLQFSGRERRCRNCGAWDNGSYGSHAPCGYDWSHDSLMSALEREIAARGTSAPRAGKEQT